MQHSERWKSLTRITITFLVFLLSSSFFLIIAFPRYLSQLPSFSQRLYSTYILVAIVVFVSLGVLIKYTTYPQKIVAWLRIIIPIIFSFAYFLRVSAVQFNLFSLNLSTHITLVPLVVLITGSTWYIISQKHIPFSLLLGQIVILAIQTYSLLGFLDFDRTDKRLFSQDWLSQLFSLNNSIWLILCSFGVSVVTVMSFDVSNTRKNLKYVLIFTVLIFQGLFMIYTLDNQFYTYKTLLFLIFWDFLYYPFKTIIKGTEDIRYAPRLIWSGLYHIFLFVLVLNIQYILR